MSSAERVTLYPAEHACMGAKQCLTGYTLEKQYWRLYSRAMCVTIQICRTPQCNVQHTRRGSSARSRQRNVRLPGGKMQNRLFIISFITNNRNTHSATQTHRL